MVKVAFIAITFGVLSICSVRTALAVEETPMSIPGGTLVTAEKAKELHGQGAVFIDTRVAAEYAEKHIKGAFSIPYKEKFARVSTVDPEDTFTLAELPTNKEKPLVFYCNGSPCWKSYKGAAAAIKASYTKVYWFRDGIPAWDNKGYPTE